MFKLRYAAALALLVSAGSAQADIKVGVILSTTGPATSLGVFERNGVMLGPQTIAGQKVDYIFLDDTSDATVAVKNARKLMTEDKVDVIIGPTITPAAIALIPVVAEGTTPNISQGPTNSVVQPMDENRRWVFKTTTNDEHEATPMFTDMRKKNIKSLAYIGFADGLGDQWDKLVTRYTAAQNGAPEIQVVARERYARADTSVTAQVVKMLARNPDAVLIAGSGAGAATPLLELRKRGFKRDIYVILGATFGEFLKISGSAAEGIYAPFAAVMGVDQVPDSYEAKKSAQQFVALYDDKYGKGSSNIFAAGGWDATKLIETAAPVALKKAKPGTPEFRAALRDAIENIRNLDGARGRYNMSATDHAGLDSNALMLGQFRDGRWNLVKP